MTTLPPLANLLAIRDEIPDHIADCDRDDDPRALAAITGHLTTSGDFDTVFHPAPHWVCAQKYLPDSVPDPAEARAAGLVFCEGRDEIESGHERNTRARFESLAARLQSSPQTLHEFPGDFGFLHFSRRERWVTPHRTRLSHPTGLSRGSPTTGSVNCSACQS